MINLYILETCPYCRKVMTYFGENNIPYEKLDIAEKKNRDELISLGGKEQVPFLYNPDTEQKIYESDKIIEYIKGRTEHND